MKFGMLFAFLAVLGLLIAGCSQSAQAPAQQPAAQAPASTAIPNVPSSEGMPSVPSDAPQATNPPPSTGTPSENGGELPAATEPAVPEVPGSGLPPISQQIPAAAVTEVAIRGFAFSPAEATIPRGTTVRWTNEDAAPHQIQGTIFGSDLLSTGGSYQFTFIDAGTYDYICALHPSMNGRIIVE